MAAQLQMFKEFAHPLGEQIIQWARPAGWAVGVTQVSNNRLSCLLFYRARILILATSFILFFNLSGVAPD